MEDFKKWLNRGAMEFLSEIGTGDQTRYGVPVTARSLAAFNPDHHAVRAFVPTVLDKVAEEIEKAKPPLPDDYSFMQLYDKHFLETIEG